MLIEISAPVFKCEEDENIFFLRIQGLPNYKHVAIHESCLQVTLLEPVVASSVQGNVASVSAMNELQEICDIWGTRFRILTP
ncbi:hypothetical protein [Neptuniibacter pectenicola]|uniref:hypothetical protein n=1 Tax=Neptuniibacter pectenicola TaxID=1806669 RepID=UPI00082B6EA9|nr:hypothetical protein [Neptuniibacter pectenicola]|tara:strand:- start:255 stop:500 length:246 start_codon:yes stop_codon:yes gene_type:complete